jgi:hypothetical protein
VVDDADVATTDSVGRRQRCAARQTAVAVGAATGGGGGRAGVATEGGRGYCGRQLATGVWRAAAVGGRAGRAHGAGAWGGWAATDGDAATGDGRPAVFRQRVGSTMGVEARGRERRRLFGREKERRKGIADWPSGYFE